MERSISSYSVIVRKSIFRFLFVRENNTAVEDVVKYSVKRESSELGGNFSRSNDCYEFPAASERGSIFGLNAHRQASETAVCFA